MKKIIPILLLLCLANSGFSQVVFEHLSKKQGLPNNNITSIVQDKQGFMWFGSYNGLTRYDGNSFKYFNTDKSFPYKIEDNQIRDLYVDENGLIYIAFNYKGFAIYNPETGSFRYFRNNPKYPENTLLNEKIFSISKAPGGKIWIATESGLNLFDQATESFSLFQIPDSSGIKLNKQGVSYVVDDLKENLWIYTLKNEVIRYKRSEKSFTYYNLPVKKNVPVLNRGGVLFRDSENKIWIGTEYYGLFSLNPATGNIKAYMHSDYNRPYKVIMDIIEDEEKNLWVATDGDGLIKISLDNDSSEEFTHDPFNGHSLSTNAIYCLYRTKPGIMWIGLYAGGVNTYKKKKRKFYSITDLGIEGKRLSNKSILCFAESPDGKVLIGTDGGGLNIFNRDKKTFNYKTSETGYCFNIVKSLYKDSKNRIWAGSYGEGVCLTEKSDIHKNLTSSGQNHPDFLNHSSVWSIKECKDGSIWFGLLENGIDIMNPETGKIEHLTIDSLGMPLGNVYSIIQDSKNRIWAASEEACLLLYNEEKKKFTSFNPKNTSGFFSYYANVVIEDSKGNIWVGFENGGVSKLTNIDNKTAENISVENGLPGSSVHGIIEDKNGILWFSTDNGLASYNPASKKIHTFGLEDGLVGMEFKKGATFQDDKGYLYFGSGEGLIYFHPDSLWYNPFKPSAFLTSIKVLNREITGREDPNYIEKSIPFSKELTLTHNDYIVSFEFSALDYLIPEKNKYAYMLEGFDKNWVYVDSDRRYATYTSLPPGDYRFLFKASNNDGLWNETPQEIKITVLPPWWKTVWFKSLLILLVSGLVAILMYLRIRNEKKQRLILESLVEKRTAQLNKSNATKDKLFSIIAHDLKGPVNSIKGLASMLENYYGKMPEADIKTAIGHIAKSSNSLSDLLNNLFSWARLHTKKLEPVKEVFEVDPVIERIIKVFNIQSSDKNIRIYYKNSAANTVVYADPNMYETVIRNLVNNALKFTEQGGTILISCYRKKDLTITSVKDNGIGMDEELVSKIFNQNESRSGTKGETGTGLGLTICYDFIKANNGSIAVKSKKGEGTEFEVILQNSKRDET